MNTKHALLTLLVLTTTAPAQIHSWRAENDAADDRGDYWGDRQGDSTFAPGVSGQAFSFDGVDDTIRLLSRPPLPPPWTLAAWVKRQDAPGESASLLYDDQSAIKIEQWPSTRKVGFTQFGVADYTFNYSLPAGRWTHLVMTATTTTTTLYIDGEEVETLPQSVNLPRSWIGGGVNDRLHGLADEMEIRDKALTQSEVRLIARQVFGQPPARREWNPLVRDAVAATNALTTNGEPLAFRPGAGAQIAFGPPAYSSSHYQGIQRWERPGRLPYLFVTRSGYDIDQGNLAVVEMGSRGRDGERMRSNRLQKGTDVNDTAPPTNDRVVRNIRFPYRHPGAVQLVGDILAVALEDPQEDSGLPMGRVVFYDVSEPLNPVELPTVVNSWSHNIGVAGMTRLPDGHFLLVTTWGSNEKLEFYRSNKTSFFEPGFTFALHDEWLPSEIPGGAFPSGMGTNYQCLSLFNQEDGAVFLVGARNMHATSPIFNGEDRIRLFRVNGWHAGGTISMSVQTGEIHMRCSSEGTASSPRRGATARINADFLASVGTYISPSGELLFYATEHWNDGPDASVRFVEFHHNKVARPGSPAHYVKAHAGGPYRVNEGSTITVDAGRSLPVRVKPWIELFDDDNYGGSSVMIDWDDYFREDYQDFRELPWNDRASSLRCFVPPDYKVILHDGDNYLVEDNEPYLSLGFVSWGGEIANLSDEPWEFDNGGLHETRVTSVRFEAPASNQVGQPLGYSWQMPASAASYVKFVDSTKTEQTTLKGLDGPHIAVASAVVTQPGPFGVMTDTAHALVEVINLPPSITDFKVESVSGAGGATVRFDLRYSDPGPADTHTIQIDWGDGQSESVQGNAGGTSVVRTHQYLDDDPALPLETFYDIVFTITDDDGGGDSGVTMYRVIWRTNASTADGDGDSLPDYWEDTRLRTRLRSGVEDSDRDGRTNRDEYLAGTDPLNSADCFALEMSPVPDGRLAVSFFARRISGSGYGTLTRRYRLEYSKHLEAGGWQALPGFSSITGADQTVLYVDAAGDRMFFRGIVTLE